MSVATSPIQLARRVVNLKPSTTLAVTARVKELRAAGRDVIGFGAGEPDFDTPELIKQAAADALRTGRTGYEPVPGPLATRAAIAEKLRDENGIECAAEHVVINAGAKHSVYLAIQALVDPGREVVVPTPAWVSYRPMVELAGGVVIEVPGAVDNDFKITPAQLEAALTPRTAMVMINSPSNPCGTMYTPDELRALAEVLVPHEHVAILSDEIYEKLVFGGIPHFSMGSIGALAERVITVNGLSKAYAMTGWRLGYVCAPGADGAIARAISRLQGQMTSHPTSFCLPAIDAALAQGGPEVERMRQAFAQRAERMHALVSAMPGVVCPRPTGAFYVFPHVGAHFGRTSPGGVRIDSALAFAGALLEEALVGVVPGEDFGACAAAHVRLSFATDLPQLEEGCRRLGEWLGRLS